MKGVPCCLHKPLVELSNGNFFCLNPVEDSAYCYRQEKIATILGLANLLVAAGLVPF